MSEYVIDWDKCYPELTTWYPIRSPEKQKEVDKFYEEVWGTYEDYLERQRRRKVKYIQCMVNILKNKQ
jgi:hypothetical protein